MEADAPYLAVVDSTPLGDTQNFSVLMCEGATFPRVLLTLLAI
jgi:hypothetical protein